MYEVRGPISDRIRSGQIKADPLAIRPAGELPPAPQSIRDAGGRGLGNGAARGRNGGS